MTEASNGAAPGDRISGLADALDDGPPTAGVIAGNFPTSPALRSARFGRALVLLAAGVAIAFTAPMHQNLEANRWMVSASLLLLGLMTLVEHIVQRGDHAAWPIAVRAALLFFAAGGVLVAESHLGLAIVIAIWAIANAVLVYASALTGLESSRQALPAALLSLALGAVALILRDDPVAVLGFFGVYAVICGVFLGISAFDGRPRAEAPATAE